MGFVRCIECDRLLEAVATESVLGLDQSDTECACLAVDYEVAR